MDSQVCHGQISIDNAALALTMTDADTFYPLVSSESYPLVASQLNGMTANVATGHGEFILGAYAKGIYDASYSITYYTDYNNLNLHGALFRNGEKITTIASERDVVSGSSVLASGSSGLIDLNAGDVVDFRLSSAVAGKTATFSHVSIKLNCIEKT